MVIWLIKFEEIITTLNELGFCVFKGKPQEYISRKKVIDVAKDYKSGLQYIGLDLEKELGLK